MVQLHPPTVTEAPRHVAVIRPVLGASVGATCPDCQWAGFFPDVHTATTRATAHRTKCATELDGQLTFA